ncbi:MAG: response regulator [Clostridia bacterium]|nr:response regulator [Clostridia bacterium]
MEYLASIMPALNIFSAICMIAGFILVAFQKPSDHQKQMLIMYMMATMTALGYCFKVEATTIEGLLMAQKLIFICTIILYYLLMLFYVRFLDLEVSNVIKGTFMALNLFEIILVFFLDSEMTFYASTWVETHYGIHILMKTYGPFFWLYIGTLVIYCTTVLFVAIYSFFSNGRQKFANSCRMLLVVFFLALPVFAELNRNIYLDFDSVGMMIALSIQMYYIYVKNIYDVSMMAQEYIFASVNDALIVLDDKMLFRGCNDLAKAVFPELASMKYRESIYMASEKLVKLVTKEVSEINMRGRDYAASLRYIGGENSEIVGAVLWLSDVTSQRIYKNMQENYQQRLKAEKEAAERETAVKSAFLLNMSSDIRTPVNSILGLNEMIFREATEENVRKYAFDMRDAGKSLMGVVNDIMSYSKIETGKLRIVPEEYSLVKAIYDFRIMHVTKIHAKGLTFDINIDSEIPSRFYGDILHIRQVLTSILNASVKSTEKGGISINITFSKLGEISGILKFSIRSTGTVERADDYNETEELSGDGEQIQNVMPHKNEIGMHISRHLIALMGGELKYNGENGTGSEYYFEVRQEVRDWEPVGDVDDYIQRGISTQNADSKLFIAPNASILAVDDVELNLVVLEGLLKTTQASVDIAMSGAEAVEKCKQKKYDLIFMDHMMPEMDGVEALSRIKSDSDSLNSGTPCIVITANATVDSREIYIQDGFAEYIAKPVMPDKLEAVVRAYLPENLVESVESVEDDAEKDGLLAALRMIPELDVERGIKVCGGKVIYKQVIKEFMYTAMSRNRQIETCFESGEIPEFQNHVHVLKNSLRLIGAMRIYEIVTKIEEIGIRNDPDAIDEMEKVVMTIPTMCEELVIKLNEVFEQKEEDEKPQIEKEVLSHALAKILEGIEDFDFDVAVSVIADLEKYSMPDNFRTTYDKLKKYIAEVAVDDIITLLENVSL